VFLEENNDGRSVFGKTSPVSGSILVCGGEESSSHIVHRKGSETDRPLIERLF
jgi:hypothetical protein